MSGRAVPAATHFERMASDYDGARPPYPPGLFDALAREGAIGPGRRVLEIGAGTGLATQELVRRGSRVVAVEPGRELATRLRASVPSVDIQMTTIEQAELPAEEFDAAVAATSMHWVDLPVALPRLHRALRPGGLLAVFRHVFGDHTVQTAFRDHVSRVVTARAGPGRVGISEYPTMLALARGGWFRPMYTCRWKWSVDLSADQVQRLFATFSDWSPDEVDSVVDAVHESGGTVTEHYQSVLHLLRRAP